MPARLLAKSRTACRLEHARFGAGDVRAALRRHVRGAQPTPARRGRRAAVLTAARSAREPGIPLGVARRVVGVEIDEAPLDQEIANLEHVAPATCLPFVDTGAPLAIPVDTVARALAGEGVGARHDPVEMRVVVDDRLDRAA